ncbi:MAG: glycosyltransferase family 2 protein [Christensenellales bacterium]|jgi:glycosyltransferase involved in cell wall biosynthesis
MGELILSVLVLAYNHEKYIQKALDSILMQRLDFEYEIVVGEDCSTDATADILKEYDEKWPGRFRLLLRDKNLGMNENANATRAACRGKYIAVLEGDDFWTDPLKLQKQLGFLEANKEFSAVVHKVAIVDEEGRPTAALPFKRFYNGSIYTIEHVEAGFMPGQAGSLVYRNIFKTMDAEKLRLFNECDCITDAKIAMFLSLHGPIYCMDDVMGAYRRITSHGESWSAATKGENLSLTYYRWVEERIRLAKAITGRELEFKGLKSDIGYHAFVRWLKRPNNSNFSVFLKLYKKISAKPHLIWTIIKGTLGFPFRAAWRVMKNSLRSYE